MDSHTLPRKDLAELLSTQFFIVIKISLNLGDRGMDTLTKGLARTGAEPRKIVNQCTRLVVETGNNTENALEPDYDRKSLILIV